MLRSYKREKAYINVCIKSDLISRILDMGSLQRIHGSWKEKCYLYNSCNQLYKRKIQRTEAWIAFNLQSREKDAKLFYKMANELLYVVHYSLENCGKRNSTSTDIFINTYNKG